MSFNLEPAFVDPALLQTAAKICEKRLDGDPENRDLLRSLSEIHRKLGNLEQSAALYARLHKFNPMDQEAGYLHGVLAGTDCPFTATGLRAAPFVLIKNWLPQPLHDDILSFVASVEDRFEPVADGKTKTYRPDARQTVEFRGNWPAKNEFRSHLVRTLEDVIPRLRLPSFETARYEIQVRAYQDGHFFRIHRDAESEFDHRVLNYVYYFHRVPRPYSGGELLLFDSDIDDVNAEMTTSRFTCIVPEDNTIVFFPPNFYHSVIRISCPSRQFADSRFVINGHVVKRVQAKPASSDIAAVAS